MSTVVAVRPFGVISSAANCSAEEGSEGFPACVIPATPTASTATDPTAIHQMGPVLRRVVRPGADPGSVGGAIGRATGDPRGGSDGAGSAELFGSMSRSGFEGWARVVVTR